MIEKLENSGPPKEIAHAATHIDDGARERKAPVGFDAPDFASDEAAEAWIAAGMPALPAKASSKNGYTVAEVKKAAGPQEE